MTLKVKTLGYGSNISWTIFAWSALHPAVENGHDINLWSWMCWLILINRFWILSSFVYLKFFLFAMALSMSLCSISITSWAFTKCIKWFWCISSLFFLILVLSHRHVSKEEIVNLIFWWIWHGGSHLLSISVFWEFWFRQKWISSRAFCRNSEASAFLNRSYFSGF